MMIYLNKGHYFPLNTHVVIRRFYLEIMHSASDIAILKMVQLYLIYRNLFVLFANVLGR